MKTIKILALGLLAGLMLVGGCKKNKVEPTPEPEVVEPETPEEPEPEVAHYTPTEVMEYIATTFWGTIEEGDLNEPDEDGVVTSNWTIGLNVENPEDSEECLNSCLNYMAESVSEILSIAVRPAYTANAIQGSIGISQMFLITEDEEVVSWMYDYCYNGSIAVHFEAGPVAAYMSNAE